MAVGDLNRLRSKLGLPGSREREACVKSDKGEMQSKRKSAPARRTPICMSWLLPSGLFILPRAAAV